jgi:hypothetical protein
MTHWTRVRFYLPAVSYSDLCSIAVIRMLTRRRVPCAKAWAQLYAARALQYWNGFRSQCPAISGFRPDRILTISRLT